MGLNSTCLIGGGPHRVALLANQIKDGLSFEYNGNGMESHKRDTFALYIPSTNWLPLDIPTVSLVKVTVMAT